MRARSILCALAGATLLMAAAPPGSGSVSAASIKAHFETDPVLGETFRALRDDYPGEYERLVRLTVEGAEAHPSDAEMRQLGFEMHSFTATKLPLIARAPNADLRALALAYAALMHALQRNDTGLCARFAAKGFQASDIIPPDAMKALAHVNALQVHAMRHAETSPGASRGALSPADATAFLAAVAQANAALAPLLRDQAKMNAASDADKCALGVAIYDAVSSMPEAQAANVIAVLIVSAPDGS